MAKLEINVQAKPHSTFAQGLSLAYSAANPTDPTAKYLDPSSGDIALPLQAGEITLAFRLLTDSAKWPDRPGEVYALSFLSDGHEALRIKEEADPGGAHPSMVFGAPALSHLTTPLGIRPNRVVSVTDKNATKQEFLYCLTIAATSGGHVTQMKCDPRIRNGAGTQHFGLRGRNVLIGLGLLVAAVFVYCVRAAMES